MQGSEKANKREIALEFLGPCKGVPLNEPSQERARQTLEGGCVCVWEQGRRATRDERRLGAKRDQRREKSPSESSQQRAGQRECARDGESATKKSEYGRAVRAANAPRSPPRPLPRRSFPPPSPKLVSHHRPPLVGPLLFSSPQKHRGLSPV